MTQLICDCGGTKAAWRLIDDANGEGIAFETAGMNPSVNNSESLAEALAPLRTQLESQTVDCVWFYGAGCTPATIDTMRQLLRQSTDCDNIFVASDMLGAARALCGCNEGIACILGTGANSCYYNGRDIQQNTPSLGYILGDEGGGAVLGRTLINRLYKGIFPVELRQQFEDEMRTNLSTIIEHVYRRPMANSYLATFTHFIAAHRDNEHIHQLLKSCFGQFFASNIQPYNRCDLKVSFVGSLAVVFNNELSEAARNEGFELGEVLRSPIEKLALFHSNKGVKLR